MAGIKNYDPLVTKDGKVGFVHMIKDGTIEADLGDEIRILKIDDIDVAKTVLLKACYALDNLSKILGAEPPAKERTILFPTPPTAPFIEKLPPSPPGVEVELPRPVLEKIETVDRVISAVMKQFEEAAKEKEALLNQLEELKVKQKELNTKLKGLKEEDLKRANELVDYIDKTTGGIKEMTAYMAKVRELLLYIFHYKVEVLEEPSEAEVFMKLMEIYEKEAPKLFRRIKQDLAKISEELKDKTKEQGYYFAILPFEKVKGYVIESQLRERITDIFRKFIDWVRSLWYTVQGWWETVKNLNKSLDDFIEKVEGLIL